MHRPLATATALALPALLALVPGCPDGPEAMHRAPARLAFFDVAGFPYGAPVTRLPTRHPTLGERTTSDLSGYTYYRYGRDLSFAAAASGRVAIVTVESARGLAALAEIGGGDAAATLFGETIEAIRARLGEPDHANAGFYEFRFTDGRRSGMVKYFCPDAHGHRCERMTVHWDVR